MIVMKFGGSSVGDAERVRSVAGIVRKNRSRNPVVVVSALRGVTDSLLALAQEALQGRQELPEELRRRHEQMAADLEVSPSLLQENFQELSVLLKGISLVKELTPRTLDYVASFGERLSSRLIAAHFSQSGIPSRQHDAFDIGMLTDDAFGSAQPLPEAFEEIRRRLPRSGETAVVTGYIGKTRNGDITTLGRNGSDFTATILGAALDAEEVQIWSDTDGIMTADPRIVPQARPIPFLTFEEASELAYYGGKVLHPATIIPAIQKRIPVRVLNTFRPEHPGTTIVAALDRNPAGVKSIAHHLGNYVINVSSSRMLMGHGFLSRIFEVFARHRIVINMVSTSEVTVSVTTDNPRNLDEAARDLQPIGEITVEKGRAVICVVGEGLRSLPGVAGEVFTALRQADVNVLMISQGASKINLAFVVRDEDASRAVQALHQRFFP